MVKDESKSVNSQSSVWDVKITNRYNMLAVKLKALQKL